MPKSTPTSYAPRAPPPESTKPVMGRVMAALKERYAGQMDFGAVGPAVKDRLLA